jgi:TonB family protein
VQVEPPPVPFGAGERADVAPTLKPAKPDRPEQPELAMATTTKSPDKAVESEPPQPPAPPQAQPAKDTPNAQTASAEKASAPSARGGEPAPQSESDIDAFSKTGGVKFRAGKTDVQYGRKAKLTRPKITISGQFDLISLRSPRLTLEIRADANGDVYDVRLIRSSGSTDVDLACQRAAYDWWFEPPKDPSGKPRADIFPYTIAFID